MHEDEPQDPPFAAFLVRGRGGAGDMVAGSWGE